MSKDELINENRRLTEELRRLTAENAQLRRDAKDRPSGLRHDVAVAVADVHLMSNKNAANLKHLPNKQKKIRILDAWYALPEKDRNLQSAQANFINPIIKKNGYPARPNTFHGWLRKIKEDPKQLDKWKREASETEQLKDI